MHTFIPNSDYLTDSPGFQRSGWSGLIFFRNHLGGWVTSAIWIWVFSQTSWRYSQHFWSGMGSGWSEMGLIRVSKFFFASIHRFWFLFRWFTICLDEFPRTVSLWFTRFCHIFVTICPASSHGIWVIAAGLTARRSPRVDDPNGIDPDHGLIRWTGFCNCFFSIFIIWGDHVGSTSGHFTCGWSTARRALRVDDPEWDWSRSWIDPVNWILYRCFYQIFCNHLVYIFASSHGLWAN